MIGDCSSDEDGAEEIDITSTDQQLHPSRRPSAYVADLRRGLSPDRLASYRPTGGDDLAMAANYFWNTALCQTLYPSLSALEVSMRNGIHGALSAHFATTAWYDIPQLLLPRESAQISDAKRKIRRSGKPIAPPRVVAALSLGFWTSILDTGYGARIWIAKNPAVLVRQAFPYAPLHMQVRSRAHDRFNTIRFLRNRVFHYEPIWKGVSLPDGRTASLADLHADIVDSIGWVDPTLQASVVAFDRFPHTLRGGRATVRSEIEHHLGIN